MNPENSIGLGARGKQFKIIDLAVEDDQLYHVLMYYLYAYSNINKCICLAYAG